MEKVINCPCGFVLKGASDEEVVAKWLTSVERLPLCSTGKLERNRDYYVRVNARKRPQRTFPFAWTGPTSGQAKFTFIP